MTLEFTNDRAESSKDNSEALRFQAFNPGDRQALTVNDMTDHSELIRNHDRLAEEIAAHAERIASAALKTVNSLPLEHQMAFWAGVPKFSESDPVYSALHKQREGTASC